MQQPNETIQFYQKELLKKVVKCIEATVCSSMTY